MPADDSPAILVAKYLRSSGYKKVQHPLPYLCSPKANNVFSIKTLSAFLEESGILESQISSSSDLTIEKVLEEKRLYDLSVKLERVLAVDYNEGGLPGGEFAVSCLSPVIGQLAGAKKSPVQQIQPSLLSLASGRTMFSLP